MQRNARDKYLPNSRKVLDVRLGDRMAQFRFVEELERKLNVDKHPYVYIYVQREKNLHYPGMPSDPSQALSKYQLSIFLSM